MLFLYFTSVFFILFAPGGVHRAEILPISVIMVYGLISNNISRIKIFKAELITLFMMFLFACITIIIANLSGNVFVWRDAMIFPRLLYYASIIICSTCVINSNNSYNNYKHFAMAISILLIIISFAQYYNIFGLNKYFIQLYRPGYTWLTDMDSWRRVIGTMGNPNYWGLVLSIFFMTMFYFFVFDSSITCLPIMIGLMISMIFTGSRTAVIITTIGVFLGTLCNYRLLKMRHFAIGIIIMSLVGTSFYYFTHSKYYEDKNRFKITNVQTLVDRYNHWMHIGDFGNFNLLFGNGPNKEAKQRWVDNSYLRLTTEYGAVGLICYLTFLIIIFLKTLRNINKSINNNLLSIFIFIISAWIVFEFVADGWDFLRSGSLFLALYAYSFASLSPNIKTPFVAAPDSSASFDAD